MRLQLKRLSFRAPLGSYASFHLYPHGFSTATIFRRLQSKTGIDMTGNRPMLILHCEIDQGLPYQSSVDFYDYAKSVGADIELKGFASTDHTEGVLTATDRYAQALTGFLDRSLSN